MAAKTATNGAVLDAPAPAESTAKAPARGRGAKTVERAIIIPKMRIGYFKVCLVGDTGLITNKWSEKAKKQMRDKQMKVATAGRAAKDPDADFKGSLYEHPDGGYGFPSIAFKSAAVDACSHADGVTKVEARGAFHIDGELVKIKGKPTMREDMVRLAGPGGSADLRYRGEFQTWSTEFIVRYNANVLSDEQIINLFNVAGFAIGVGEWRPQKDGRNGMFHVAESGK